VHLHDVGNGRTVKCTSPVCHQQYLVKESEKKLRKEASQTNKSRKRKRDLENEASEEALSERKRMKCHQETFEALCGNGKKEPATGVKPYEPITFNDLPLDMKLMICE
jgi:hypothetical protein